MKLMFDLKFIVKSNLNHLAEFSRTAHLRNEALGKAAGL